MDQQLSQKTTNKVINNLQAIVNQSTYLSKIPIKLKDGIRIGDYLIETQKNGGYYIVDVKKNRIVLETYTKTAALAWAFSKSHQRQEYFKPIQDLDKIIEKNQNDSKFYQHIIKTSTDDAYKEATSYRLEIAVAQSVDAERQLQSIIFQ